MLIESSKLPSWNLYWSAGYNPKHDTSVVVEANRGLWSNLNIATGIFAALATLAGCIVSAETSLPWLLTVLSCTTLWVIFTILMSKNAKRKRAYDALLLEKRVIPNADRWSGQGASLKTAWGIFAETVYTQWLVRHPINKNCYGADDRNKQDFVRMLSRHSSEVNGFLQDPAVKASVTYINDTQTDQSSRDDAELALMLFADQIGQDIFTVEDLQNEQQAVAMRSVSESIARSTSELRELNAA